MEPKGMTKYLLMAIATLVLALGGSLWYARYETQEAAKATLQADALSKQLVAQQAQLRAVQKQVVQAKAKQQSAEEDLRIALDTNRSWADGRVPDDVARSLCKYGRCGTSGAGSVPSTNN